MPAPGEEDMGGNPLKEGILADGGWQNRMKRDESFASLKKKAMDDFDWDDDDDMGNAENPYQPYETQEPYIHSRFIVTPNGQLLTPSEQLMAEKGPDRVFHEDIANEHGIPNFTQGHSLGTALSDGTVHFDAGNASGLDPQTLASLVHQHFPNHHLDPNSIAAAPASQEERFGLDRLPYTPQERNQLNFGDKQRQEQQAVDQRGGRPFNYYDNPYFNRGGSTRDRMYLPWSLDTAKIAADFDVEQVIPAGPHTEEVDVGEANPLILQHDDPNVVGDAKTRLESATKTSFLPMLLGLAGGALGAEALGGAAAGRIGGSLAGHLVGRALEGGPGGGNAALNGPSEVQQSWDTLSSIKEADWARDTGNWLKDNVTTPAHNTIYKLMGSPFDGGSTFDRNYERYLRQGIPPSEARDRAALDAGTITPEQFQQRQQYHQERQLNSIPTADMTWDDPRNAAFSIHERLAYDHPSSNPGYDDTDDPGDVDQHEHNDGDHTNFDDDIDSAGGSDGFDVNSELGQAFVNALPSLMKYYDSPESGKDDPAIASLVEAMEREMPGMIGAQPSDDDLRMIDEVKGGGHQDDSQIPPGHTAAGVPGIGMAPGTQTLAPVGPNNSINPMSQGSCPHCGAMVTPGQGVCPQCNSAVSPMQQGATAVNPQAPVGPAGQAMQPVMAANQGPHNPEQFQAVMQYLQQEGRDELIPDLIEHPENYGDILAEIQGKSQPPNPDPDPGPAPPMDPSMMMQQGMPSGGGGMPPQGMPMQGRAGGIGSRMEIDLPCPHCHKTGGVGYYPSSQDCQCRNCGYEFPAGNDQGREQQMDVEDYRSPEGLEPAPAGLGPIHQGAADPVTPPCPKCGSHTTGIITDSGQAQCSNCNHKWQTNVEVQGEKTPVQPKASAENPWVTQDGQPLVVGQEYEMYSSKYDVPDVVKITAVKPNSIEYTLTGAYGLEHRTAVTREEAQLDGLSFVSSDGADDMAPDTNLNEQQPNDQMQVPAETHQANSESDVWLLVYHYGLDERTAREVLADPKTQGIVQQWKQGIPDVQTEPGRSMLDESPWDFQNRRMKAAQAPGNEIDPQVLPHFQQAFQHARQNGVDQAHQFLLQNLQRYDPRRATSLADDWRAKYDRLFGNGGPMGEPNFAPNDVGPNVLKMAGKKFTPMEQREFIDEPGKARNAEKLDLEGTHYTESRTHSLLDDSYFLFGL
jgi:hypothetical protein